MPRRLPPLNAMRAFEAAARHGAIAKAAEELAVTPSAVSEQVRLLEARLGVKLFHRRAQGVTLTSEGAALLPGLTDAFDRLAAVSDSLGERRKRTRVAVSLLPSLAAAWLVPRLPALRVDLPSIELHVRAERQIVDFAREDVDVAIRFGAGPFRDLVAQRLMGESVFPVCSPALAYGSRPLRSFADLQRHTLLHDIDAPGQPWLSWQTWFAREGLAPAAAATGLFFNDSMVILSAAIDGQGVALGRGPMVHEHLAHGRLVRVLDREWPADWSYWIVAPPGHMRRPAVRDFVEWLKVQAAAST
jgi:LysR family glycine cleavage system transcriptional activator